MKREEALKQIAKLERELAKLKKIVDKKTDNVVERAFRDWASDNEFSPDDYSINDWVDDTELDNAFYNLCKGLGVYHGAIEIRTDGEYEGKGIFINGNVVKAELIEEREDDEEHPSYVLVLTHR